MAESDSDADFYSAIYSALYLLGTNGHLSIIEPEAYFSDYLPAAGQYRREGKTHWAEVLDSTDTQTRYRKLLALEQAANGTDAESSIPGSGSDTPNLTTLLLPGGTTGYLKIDRFPADYTSDAAALEAFYLQCAGCTDLILDLTDNSGGSELYWEQLLVGGGGAGPGARGRRGRGRPALGPGAAERQQQPLSGRGLLPLRLPPPLHSAGAARAGCRGPCPGHRCAYRLPYRGTGGKAESLSRTHLGAGR